MYSVILTELGISVFDEGGIDDDNYEEGEEGVFVKSFPFNDPVKDYLSVKDHTFMVKDLVEFLKHRDSSVLVSDGALASILKKHSIDVQIMEDSKAEKIQATKPQILVKSKFAKDIPDAMKHLRDFAMNLSSSKVTEVSQSADLHIIQAINSLDEVDKIINSLSSRLREWYGLHFPELDNIVDSIQGYSQIVLAGKRKDMDEKTFENAGFPESKIDMLSIAKERSRGGDISQENLSIVQTIAKQILDLHNLRKTVEDHIEEQMNSMAPNLSAILGTSVGARTLAKAGSLKKLASLPASTIQVLGAEKALFRSLKTGSQPPKHGLLFQHPLVHAAPRWQRGKIARVIAAKAAIASRVDVYGGGLNKTLLEKLNVRVDEIGKKYDKPIIKEKPQRQTAESGTGSRESRGKKKFKKSKSKGKSRSKKVKKGKKRKKFGRR